MGMAEPAGQLWPVVRGYVPDLWPEDDEDTARAVGDGWRRGNGVTTQAMTDTNTVDGDLGGAWRDDAGATAQDGVRLVRQRLGSLGGDMNAVAADADRYAQALLDTKLGIAGTISANESLYVNLGNAMLGVLGPALQAGFAKLVADHLDGMVDSQAAALAGGAIPLSTPGLEADPNAAPPAPPPNATPQQNKDWWNSLTRAQQDRLIKEHPELVGNRNGLPAGARDAANRNILNNEIPRLEGERDRLQRELDAIPPVEGTEVARGDLQDRINDINQMLGSPGGGVDERGNPLGPTGMYGLKAKLDSTAGLPENRRFYLLGFDTGGNGHAIVAQGNPDTATNVATFVPGVGSNLGGIVSAIGPPGANGSSGNIYDSANKYAPGGNPNTSVITWYGYDAPQDLAPGAVPFTAQESAPLLTDFQNGLRTSHVGAPSHNTIIAHSYGSTLTGAAAQDGGLAADDLVFVGSPGVNANNVSDLNFPAEHVYATESDSDVLAHVANAEVGDPPTDIVNGPDPTLPSFGARVYQSDPNLGHGQYWDPTLGPRSVDNLGRIATGQQPN